MSKNLFKLVHEGKTEELRRVLARGPVDLNVQSPDPEDYGFPPLHIAVMKQNTEMVKLLLDHGASTESINSMKETPLIMGGIYSTACVEMLLAAGARPDVCDWSGMTALGRANEKLKFWIKMKEEGSALADDAQIVDLQRRTALLEEALANRGKRSDIISEADELREAGNAAFKAANYREAIKLYSESLQVFLDYRSLSNRAMCYLKLGDYSNARQDAHQCTTLEPKFAKGWFRLAKAQCGLRDFPRARMSLHDSLKFLPDEPSLKEMFDKLVALGVPESVLNPLVDQGGEAAVEAVRLGAEPVQCVYCGGVLPLQLARSSNCVHCGCNPLANINVLELEALARS